MKGKWSGDLECLREFVSGDFKNVDTKEHVFKFVHPKYSNSHREFVKWCYDNISSWVTFNGLSYDYPLIHFGMNLVKSNPKIDVVHWLSRMKQKSNELINSDKPHFNYVYGDKYFFTIDLYKIAHFDNKAKRQSLKGLACNLNYPNIQEMPIHHDSTVSVHQIPQIAEYNGFDTDITDLFLAKSIDKIRLRREYEKKYELPMGTLINLSNSSLGERIVILEYCKATGRPYEEVKTYRTPVKTIDVKDVIIPEIQFETDYFKEKIKPFIERTITVADLKQSDSKKTKMDYSFKIKNNGQVITFDLGNGGLHASLKGLFRSKNGRIIMDCDVEGYYPAITIKHNIYPPMFGPIFIPIYKDKIVDESARLKALGKNRHIPKAEKDLAKLLRPGLKEAGNSTFGKSNSEHSPFYYPVSTAKITVNGQLMLLMLAEQFMLRIPTSKLLQANTDGLTLEFDEADLDTYYDICSKWQEHTGMKLEFVKYEWMALRDVN